MLYGQRQNSFGRTARPLGLSQGPQIISLDTLWGVAQYKINPLGGPFPIQIQKQTQTGQRLTEGPMATMGNNPESPTLRPEMGYLSIVPMPEKFCAQGRCTRHSSHWS